MTSHKKGGPRPNSLSQRKTLSLTNAFTFPIEFQIAPKMMSQLSGVAGALSSKKPKLYYSLFYVWFNSIILYMLRYHSLNLFFQGFL